MVSEVGSCENLGCGLFDGVGGRRHVLKIEGGRLYIIAITYNIYYPSYHSPLSKLRPSIIRAIMVCLLS